MLGEKKTGKMIRKATTRYTDEEIFRILTPEIRRWFKRKFGSFTPPQRYAVKEIHNGRNTLISSPTGSGKTLSAFLSAINELFLLAKEGKLEDKIYVLYVSPLKALNNDIERNLQIPLKEIYAENMMKDQIRIGVRTGDTPQNIKQQQMRKPPHIFITTPETLSIVINAPKFSQKLEEVRWIIVDEIHSLADNKRGVHLSLSLERLTMRNKKPPVRIGLSATISPLEEVAKFLVGYNDTGVNDCLIVDVNYLKKTDFKVISPVEDLVYTSAGETSDALYTLLDELISTHQTTLIFTNTRSATERVVFQLKKRFSKYEGRIEAHHGSLSRDVRLSVEEKLKNGDLKCVVCSTSLELGIDIGYIDLVVMLGSPKSISRALQRVGRSGHCLHSVSKGRIIVLDRDDLVECVVLTKQAKKGRLDRITIPTNALDVLAQHVVGMGVMKKWMVDEALTLIRRTYPYHLLPEEDFKLLLRYLAGEYEELEHKKVFGKIWFDERDQVFGRRGKLTRPIYYLNTGTIPDEVAVKVYTRNQYVGKIEERFVERLKPGDIFVLAGKTYEFLHTRGMRVYAEPRPEASPTIPSWFSEQLPLSYDLATEIRKFRGVLRGLLHEAGETAVLTYLQDEYGMDERTSLAVYHYFAEQDHFFIPTDEELLIEEFVDEEGWNHYVFHTLIGRKGNDALSRIFASRITQMKSFNVRISISDNGFVISYPEWYHTKISDDELRDLFFIENPEEVLKSALHNTEILKRRFRHVATRSFLILKNYLGHEMSVARQQRNAMTLLKVVQNIDQHFPALKETYREIMEDSMDIENIKQFLRLVQQGRIKIVIRYDTVPSPFAFNLIAIGASDVVLMEDRKKLIQTMHQQVMERIGWNITK